MSGLTQGSTSRAPGLRFPEDARKLGPCIGNEHPKCG